MTELEPSNLPVLDEIDLLVAKAKSNPDPGPETSFMLIVEQTCTSFEAQNHKVVSATVFPKVYRPGWERALIVVESPLGYLLRADLWLTQDGTKVDVSVGRITNS